MKIGKGFIIGIVVFVILLVVLIFGYYQTKHNRSADLIESNIETYSEEISVEETESEIVETESSTEVESQIETEEIIESIPEEEIIHGGDAVEYDNDTATLDKYTQLYNSITEEQ